MHKFQTKDLYLGSFFIITEILDQEKLFKEKYVLNYANNLKVIQLIETNTEYKYEDVFNNDEHFKDNLIWGAKLKEFVLNELNPITNFCKEEEITLVQLYEIYNIYNIKWKNYMNDLYYINEEDEEDFIIKQYDKNSGVIYFNKDIYNIDLKPEIVAPKKLAKIIDFPNKKTKE